MMSSESVCEAVVNVGFAGALLTCWTRPYSAGRLNMPTHCGIGSRAVYACGVTLRRSDIAAYSDAQIFQSYVSRWLNGSRDAKRRLNTIVLGSRPALSRMYEIGRASCRE